MAECGQILAGRSDIRNYNISNDSNNQEIGQLPGNGIIYPRDFGMFKASDLIIDGILDCDTYSMTDFTPYEQIRQLENGAVCPEDFLRLAELETFDADNWLYLFQVLPGRPPQENWRQKILSPAGWNRLRNSDAISPIRQNCWRQIPDDGQN